MKSVYPWESLNEACLKAGIVPHKILKVVGALGRGNTFSEEQINLAFSTSQIDNPVIIEKVFDLLDDHSIVECMLNEQLSKSDVKRIQSDLKKGKIVVGYYQPPKGGPAIDKRMGEQKFQFLKINSDGTAEIIWLPPSRRKPYPASEWDKIPSRDKAKLTKYEFVKKILNEGVPSFETVYCFIEDHVKFYFDQTNPLRLSKRELIEYGFKDLDVVDPTDDWLEDDEDDGLVARQYHKRHIEEALTPVQRQRRRASLRKNKAKIAIGRRKAARRRAAPDVLKKRAVLQARNLIAKKITKGRSKADLTPSERNNLEKKLAKKKPAISRIAKKLFPQIKKKELERKLG